MRLLAKIWCRVTGHNLKSKYSYTTQYVYTLLGGNKYRKRKVVTRWFVITCETCGEVVASDSDSNTGTPMKKLDKFLLTN